MNRQRDLPLERQIQELRLDIRTSPLDKAPPKNSNEIFRDLGISHTQLTNCEKTLLALPVSRMGLAISRRT